MLASRVSARRLAPGIFAVEDVRAAHSALQAQGADPEPLGDAEGVRFFAFRDLDGNRLEACQVLD
jgi:catechol 2,3-dioxygenase-like lactoylglutathione lyase family enzyme